MNAQNVKTLKADPTIQAFARNWANREVEAQDKWVEWAARDFGLGAQDAVAALKQMVKLRAVKFDRTNSRWTVKHGNLWDKDVLLRAIELAK